MIGYEAIKTGADPHIIPEGMIRRYASAGWTVIGPVAGSDVEIAEPLEVYRAKTAPEPSPAQSKPKRRRGRPKGSKTRRGMFAKRE
jgi:hypothetical protein